MARKSNKATCKLKTSLSEFCFISRMSHSRQEKVAKNPKKYAN